MGRETAESGSIYRLSDEERAAVHAGMNDARSGNFVPDIEMEEFYRLHRREQDSTAQRKAK